MRVTLWGEPEPKTAGGVYFAEVTFPVFTGVTANDWSSSASRTVEATIGLEPSTMATSTAASGAAVLPGCGNALLTVARGEVPTRYALIEAGSAESLMRCLVV